MINVQEEPRTLAWRESGSGDVILFIHAFPLDSTMWEEQLRSLPDGWRAIAPDLPGFGESAAPQGVVSMDSYADALAHVLSVAGARQAVVCGLSMGGYVALALQRRHPELVRGLILCDTRAETDTIAGRLHRLELVQQTRREGMQAIVTSLMPKMVSRTTRLMRPAIAMRIEEKMRATAPESAAVAMMAMAHRPDATPRLRNIEVPTLVIVGSEDEVTPPGESQMLARGIRGARIEIIEGAAHLSNIEQPEIFNTVLRTFLSTLPQLQPAL